MPRFEYVVQTNYVSGYGWEDVYTGEDEADARARLKEYRENEPQYQHRLKRRALPFMRNCGHCHKCGSELKTVLDGEEWCNTCQTYRRYQSHGWGAHEEGGRDCPRDLWELSHAI